MEIGAVKLDAAIKMEHSANYWRERAECLEDWVCSLLRKNQALRMSLEAQETTRELGEGIFSPQRLSANRPFGADRVSKRPTRVHR